MQGKNDGCTINVEGSLPEGSSQTYFLTGIDDIITHKIIGSVPESKLRFSLDSSLVRDQLDGWICL